MARLCQRGMSYSCTNTFWRFQLPLRGCTLFLDICKIPSILAAVHGALIVNRGHASIVGLNTVNATKQTTIYTMPLDTIYFL